MDVAIGPWISSFGDIAHSLVGGRPGGHLEYVGTIPLVLLGVLRACSERKRGCVQMSATPSRSPNEQHWLEYPHLMSSDIENEHVS